MLPLQNKLLNAFSIENQSLLMPYLTLVSLQLGDVICQPEQTLDYVYFPTDIVISMFNVTKKGDASEISIVGNEGIAGIACFMKGERTPNLAVVQSAGYAYRLSASELRKRFEHHSDIRFHLLRYALRVVTQISQTTVCNRHHSIEQRLCRCLLLSSDRLSSNSLGITDESIANMVGVKREAIARAASKLDIIGIIRYTSGGIDILDRVRLQSRSCVCYKGIVSQSEQINDSGWYKKRAAHLH
jgi:CRP-like cAMP-binding protein